MTTHVCTKKADSCLYLYKQSHTYACMCAQIMKTERGGIYDNVTADIAWKCRSH